MTDLITQVAKNFEIDTAEHEMTILLDDGQYRHIRFMRPAGQSSSYWYDLITVRGALVFRGDYASHVFSREPDMFAFFRSNPDRPTRRVSPDYWAQKLTSDRDCVKTYSQEMFEQIVKEHTVEAIRYGNAPRGIGKAVREQILDDEEIYYEEGAREALNAFEHEGFGFSDTWEWSFSDFDFGYVWACHAIVAGIARYDAAKAGAKSPAGTAVVAGAVA